MPAWLCHKHVLPSSQGLSFCVRPWLVWKQLLCDCCGGEQTACMPVWNPEWNYGIVVPRRVLRSMPSRQAVWTLIILTDKRWPNPNVSLTSNISWILCGQGQELRCVFLKKKQTVLQHTTYAVSALFTASFLGTVSCVYSHICSYGTALACCSRHSIFIQTP